MRRGKVVPGYVQKIRNNGRSTFFRRACSEDENGIAHLIGNSQNPLSRSAMCHEAAPP